MAPTGSEQTDRQGDSYISPQNLFAGGIISKHLGTII